MTTNNTMNKKNIGIDNLIDGIYAPEVTPHHRFERDEKMQNALRFESGENKVEGEEPVFSLEDIFGMDFKVQKGFFGTPEAGTHTVKLNKAPEIKKGSNGLYMKLELIDAITGCMWNTFVKAEDAHKMLADISHYNNGLLARKDANAAFETLQNKKFLCWTLQTEKGTTATYFNEERFNKRLWVVSALEGKYELNKLKQKEREDNKARMAEEAQNGREEIPFDVK